MFPNASQVVVQGGTFISTSTHAPRGMDILLEWVATGAFHDSDELYDVPKCHPHTRVAVLGDIMEWVYEESGFTGDDLIMWLFGPAGAGKSAIAKKIAEIAAERGLLIADFFFSRTSPTRNSKDRLIATLAYQLTVSIPYTRSYIESAIERDPAIFKKNIATQIDALLIKPFQSIPPTQIVPSQKLIIIDGLDECHDSQSQVAILEAISRSFNQHNLRIKFLVVSRPEPDISTSFDRNKLLKSNHRRLALDDTYLPDEDIRLFFSDKFEQIKHLHPFKSTIPITWPTRETLDTLVRKSSGQFIYASTVVKFVGSNRHPPCARLNIILGISPPGRTNPFSELDALYSHILSFVDDIRLTLHVLGLYVMIPLFGSRVTSAMSPEVFLSLEPGDIQLALTDLSSIVTYDASSGYVSILHASLVDFLSDKRRSTTFYIDKASICTDFVRQILQCVKGPDGILAGHIDLFYGLYDLYSWVTKGQLRNDILNFDIDAFITASIIWRYKGCCGSYAGMSSVIETYNVWNVFLSNVALEDSDRQKALGRFKKSFESRLPIYQSDWRLQLLLALADAGAGLFYSGTPHEVPFCRRVDILLEMDDHELHQADQHALDLRHSYMVPWPDMVSGNLYVCSNKYTAAALYCMRFLSNPPKYTDDNECPEMGLIYYSEWKATCVMTCDILHVLLRQANTSLELVQFLRTHHIHPAVKNKLRGNSVDVDLHILLFLIRAGAYPNSRVVSAIESSIITRKWPSEFEENNSDSGEGEGWGAVNPEGWEATRILIRNRLDQCCFNI